MNYQDGGQVEGKAKVDGNSPKNDTIKAKLSPGEIVVDRETISKGPHAIMGFIMNELVKSHPGYKTHFDEGGTATNQYSSTNRPVSQINDKQKKAFSTVQQAGDFDKAIESGVKSLKSALGFAEGGTVPEARWDAEPPNPEELKSAESWDKKPPKASELGQKYSGLIPEDASYRGYVKGALNALPMAGAVGGGLLASETGPGAVVAAGAGGAMGNELKRIGNKYLLGEEQTSGLDHALETAGEGAMGATGEMGGQIAGKLIGKAGQALANSGKSLKAVANKQAFRAAGPMLKDVRAMGAAGKIDEIGQFALDNGIVKAGDNVESVAQKANEFRKMTGERLSNIYDKAIEGLPAAEAESARGFNPARDKSEILSTLKKELGDSPSKGQILKNAENYLDQLIEDYGSKTLDPRKANNIKSALDKEINYSRNPLSPDPVKEQAYSFLREHINDSVLAHIKDIGEASGNPELAQALIKENKNYGLARNLQKIAEDRASRETANRMLGLTDTISGVGGLGLGHAAGAAMGHGNVGAAIGAAGGAVGNKLARTYGPGVMAGAANAASKTLAPKILEPVGRGIGTAVNALDTPIVGGLLKKTAAQKINRKLLEKNDDE